MKNKVVTAEEAIAIIRDGDTLATPASSATARRKS
jgi:hypothetical protein